MPNRLSNKTKNLCSGDPVFRKNGALFFSDDYQNQKNRCDQFSQVFVRVANTFLHADSHFKTLPNWQPADKMAISNRRTSGLRPDFRLSVSEKTAQRKPQASLAENAQDIANLVRILLSVSKPCFGSIRIKRIEVGMSEYCDREWEDLCSRVNQSASHYSEKCPKNASRIRQESDDFCRLDPPETYAELLKRTSQARDLAVGWTD